MSAQELLTCDISIHVCRNQKFSRPCPFLGHSAEFLRHLCSSVEISAKFFAVIGPEFKNNYLVSNIRIPTKAVLRAKYQNSTEISKRGKIYVKLSEIWIYLPTYLSRLWKKQRRAGRSSKRWFGSDDLILLLLPWCMKSDRLIWDASKIKESTSNKPKAQ